MAHHRHHHYPLPPPPPMDRLASARGVHKPTGTTTATMTKQEASSTARATVLKKLAKIKEKEKKQQPDRCFYTIGTFESTDAGASVPINLVLLCHMASDEEPTAAAFRKGLLDSLETEHPEAARLLGPAPNCIALSVLEIKPTEAISLLHRMQTRARTFGEGDDKESSWIVPL